METLNQARRFLSFVKTHKYVLFLIIIASGVLLGSEAKNLESLIPDQPPITISDIGIIKQQAKGNWQVVPKGLVLGPGERGEVIFQIPKEKGEGAVFTFSFFSDQDLTNQVSLSLNGVDYVQIAKNKMFYENILDLTKYVEQADFFWLKLSAENRDFKRWQPALVLGKKLEIALIKNPLKLPRLDIIFLLIIIPILGFYFGKVTTKKEKIGFTFAWGLLAGEIMIRLFWPDFLSGAVNAMGLTLNFPIFFYFAVLLAYLLISIANKNTDLPEFSCLALLGIVALALSLRWEYLNEFKYGILDPDVQFFKSLALEMKHPYDTSYREPLWILIIRIWQEIYGPDDLGIKLLGVFFSLMLVLTSYKFFLDYTRSYPLALLVAFFLATNEFLIQRSPRGFRLEIYTASIMMFCSYVFVPSARLSPRTRLIGLAVWSTLLELIRINSFFFIFPFLIYSFWKFRINWPKLLYPIIAISIFLAPFLVCCYQKFGDPFYSINIHSSWYRNHEFKSNCVGCPTPEELNRNSYAGEKVAATKYIFGMHQTQEIIKNTLQGYYAIFLQHSFKIQYLKSQIGKTSLIFYYFYLAGLIFLVFSRYRILLAVPLFLINILAFLVLGTHIDVRILAHTSPFVTFFLAYGIWTPLAILSRSISKAVSNFKPSSPGQNGLTTSS